MIIKKLNKTSFALGRKSFACKILIKKRLIFLFNLLPLYTHVTMYSVIKTYLLS